MGEEMDEALIDSLARGIIDGLEGHDIPDAVTAIGTAQAMVLCHPFMPSEESLREYMAMQTETCVALFRAKRKIR